MEKGKNKSAKRKTINQRQEREKWNEEKEDNESTKRKKIWCKEQKEVEDRRKLSKEQVQKDDDDERN